MEVLQALEDLPRVDGGETLGEGPELLQDARLGQAYIYIYIYIYIYTHIYTYTHIHI